MSNVSYNPLGTGGWAYGEQFQRSTHKGDTGHLLGPCPLCGSPCYDYGGGWRCRALYCNNNESNPAPNVGPTPDWWNTTIQVKKDGNAWCAHYDDFVNLQESVAAFGDTPEEAVHKLKVAA